MTVSAMPRISKIVLGLSFAHAANLGNVGCDRSIPIPSRVAGMGGE